MEKGKLREEYLRLTQCNTIKDSFETMEIFANYMLKTIRDHHREGVKLDSDADARIVNQMMLTKLLHIGQILKGVSFETNDGTRLNGIIDPTVIATLVRNVYETATMFNLIYRYTKTPDETLILYNLWKIAGLNYRQRFLSEVTSDVNKQKANDEKALIDQLIVEIENADLFKALAEKEQDKIRQKIREKDYKIKFERGKVIFLHWHELATILGVRENVFEHLYTFFSLYAHPSNVSVFQFAEMFRLEESYSFDMANFLTKDLFLILSCFIADYIRVFPGVIKTFEKEPLLNQLVINGPNKMLRGEEYSINKSYEKLN